MTKEEKQLLLIDLCARLPYGVMCTDLQHGDSKITEVDIENGLVYCFDFDEYVKVENCHLYLRPMSSLIGKELDECRATCKYRQVGQSVLDCATPKTIDYLISHHFDYRGLIPMGLALEAKEGMYKN